jgi:Guanosine polyphosphate pyrophosphohydrolases/synthetases
LQGDEHFFQEAPISDIALVLRAAEFAAHKHRGQRRKGYSERPYVGHCIEVAALLANVGKIDDPEILAARCFMTRSKTQKPRMMSW